MALECGMTRCGSSYEPEIVLSQPTHLSLPPHTPLPEIFYQRLSLALSGMLELVFKWPSASLIGPRWGGAAVPRGDRHGVTMGSSTPYIVAHEIVVLALL